MTVPDGTIVNVAPSAVRTAPAADRRPGGRVRGGGAVVGCRWVVLLELAEPDGPPGCGPGLGGAGGCAGPDDALDYLQGRQPGPCRVQRVVHGAFREGRGSSAELGDDRLITRLAGPGPQRAELAHVLRGGGGPARAGLAWHLVPDLPPAAGPRVRAAGGAGALALPPGR